MWRYVAGWSRRGSFMPGDFAASAMGRWRAWLQPLDSLTPRKLLEWPYPGATDRYYNNRFVLFSDSVGWRPVTPVHPSTFHV